MQFWNNKRLCIYINWNKYQKGQVRSLDGLVQTFQMVAILNNSLFSAVVIYWIELIIIGIYDNASNIKDFFESNPLDRSKIVTAKVVT